MNQLDALILVLATPFALRGFWRGFCREVFGLAGLLGGTLVAGAESARLAAGLVSRHLVSPLAARAVAFGGILVVTVLAANVAGLVVDRLVRALLLGGLNRAAGVIVGLAKGAAVCSLLLLAAERLAASPALDEVIARSSLGRPLVELAARLLGTTGRPNHAGGQA